MPLPPKLANQLKQRIFWQVRAIGQQWFTCAPDDASTYRNEIAPARTFGVYEQVPFFPPFLFTRGVWVHRMGWLCCKTREERPSHILLHTHLECEQNYFGAELSHRSKWSIYGWKKILHLKKVCMRRRNFLLTFWIRLLLNDARWVVELTPQLSASVCSGAIQSLPLNEGWTRWWRSLKDVEGAPKWSPILQMVCAHESLWTNDCSSYQVQHLYRGVMHAD